jgi:N-acetylmuramoyl-L-alanine amidase
MTLGMQRPEAKSRFLPVFIVLLFWFVFTPFSQADAEKVRVKGIRHWSSEGYTRVVIDLSKPAEFTKHRLKNPERLFVDLKNCAITEDIKKTFTVSDGILRRVRTAQYSSDTVRVVLDLNEIVDSKVFFITDPPRVVIDVFGNPWRTGIRRVVIDPGHGGHDPGAIGYKGLKEKDVVLDIALRVKKILEKAGGYEVFLTRDKDVYLTLEERTVIANKKNADLFVSIHANANRRKAARGIETYLLNWTDDEEAMRVAARENAISIRRMRQARSELGFILASLELQNKRDESLKLAHYIQKAMVSNLGRKYRHVVDLGVKQALFYVLFGARMPSVLVEVSFITNYEEAKRLKSWRYREQLAQGIASGIKTYFSSTYPIQKVAQR